MIDYIDKEFYKLCESVQDNIDDPVHLYKDFEMLEGIKPIIMPTNWNPKQTYYTPLDFPYQGFDKSYMVISDDLFESTRQQIMIVLNVSNNTIKEVVIIDQEFLCNRGNAVDYSEFKNFTDRHWISNMFFKMYNVFAINNKSVKISVGIVDLWHDKVLRTCDWKLENIQSDYLAALQTSDSKKSKLSNIGAYLIKPKSYIIDNAKQLFSCASMIAYNVLANVIYATPLGDLPIQQWKMPSKKQLVFISGPNAPSTPEVTIIRESFSFDPIEQENSNEDFYQSECPVNLKDYELFFQQDGLFGLMTFCMLDFLSKHRQDMNYTCKCMLSNDKKKVVCYSVIKKDGFDSTMYMPIMAVEISNMRRLYLIDVDEEDSYYLIKNKKYPYSRHTNLPLCIDESIANRFDEIVFCSYEQLSNSRNEENIITMPYRNKITKESVLATNKFKTLGIKLYHSTFSYDKKDTEGMNATTFEEACYDCGLFRKITPITINDNIVFTEIIGFVTPMIGAITQHQDDTINDQIKIINNMI